MNAYHDGQFQSTLPIREETSRFADLLQLHVISIHSSHTGRDLGVDEPAFVQFIISIHSSHTGRDQQRRQAAALIAKFQSTLPIREETEALHRDRGNPVISIHSSHTGRDFPVNDGLPHFGPFQSTLPIREVTV